MVPWVIAACTVVGLTVLFTHHRTTFTLSTVLLSYLLVTIVVARLGGPLPAAAAGVAGFGLTNWFFVAPQRQLAVSQGRDLLSLAAYLVAVGAVVVLADEVRRLRRALAREPAGRDAQGADPEDPVDADPAV